MAGPNAKIESNASIPERQEFEVIQASRNAPDEISIGGQTMKFGSSGGFKVSDIGKAQAINDLYGHGKGGTRQVVVVPVEKPPERGHRRTFLVKLPKNYQRSKK